MADLGDLSQRAANQHGLVTVDNLRAAGIDKNATTRLTGTGVLMRLRRGIYRLAGTPASWEQDLMAACLIAGRAAVASHRAALRLWGLRSVDDELELSVRYPHDCRIDGVVVHRSIDLEPGDMTWIDGLPCTTPERTLCDAGLVFPESEVERLTHHGLSLAVVTSKSLGAFRRRVGRQGRNGVGVLHRVLERLPKCIERAESGPEIRLRQLLIERGLPEPVAQYSVVLGGSSFRFDLAYPTQRIAIEFDGVAVHSSTESFVGDRRRQNLMVLAGWSVLRFTWADLTDRPSAVAVQVSAALNESG